MGSAERTGRLAAAAEITSVAGAVLLVGVSYGALAVTAGLPSWLVVGLAVSVLAASAELLFVGALLAGAAPLVAAVGALLVNLRNAVYGLEAARFLDAGWRRALGAHFVNDETVAYALKHSGSSRQRAAFWRLGSAILLAWPLGAAIGTALGTTLPDVSVLGLDSVFPAVLVAMVMGVVRDRRAALVAACGALIAVVATPLAPVGVAPLLGLTALAILLPGRRRG